MTITLSEFWHFLLQAVAPGYAERRERERSFNEIVRQHDNLIARICFGYARSASELDDLHQDALVNIWQGLPKFRGDSSLKTWIYRITLNTCVSTLRSRSRQPETMRIDEILNLADESAEQKETIRELYDWLRQLSPKDKAIVQLWLEGLSYDEIASITGLSKSVVGTRFHRAKEKLKKSI